MRAAALSEASAGPAERTTDGQPSPVLRIKTVRKFYEDLEAIRNVSFDVADCKKPHGVLVLPGDEQVLVVCE